MIWGLIAVVVLLALAGRLWMRRANFISARDRLGPVPGRASDPARPAIEESQRGMSNDSFLGRIGKALWGKDAPATPPAAPAPRALPAALVDYEDDRIPPGAKDRIRRILACLGEVDTALTREDMPGFTRIDIDQMRQEHLPKLVKSYIDIPDAHRSEIFRKTGKSASYILNDSLDQMQHRIDAILRNLAQKDIDAFTNNTRFVGERYADDNPFD